MDSNEPERATDFLANFRRGGRNRESSDELSRMEAELRRAYAAKELETQLLERRTERYIRNVREQRASTEQLLEQQAVLEEEHRRKQSERTKIISEYRLDLVSQMRRKEEERRTAMDEARVEREVLTEVDRIGEYFSRARAEVARSEAAELTRRQNQILEEMREIRREEDAEADAANHQKNQKYLQEVDERRARINRLLLERTERKAKIALEIGKLLMCEEAERRERESLMIELITEDLKRELVIRDEEERARRGRMKRELAAVLEEQMIFTEECKVRFAEQDKAFADEVMRTIMEDERIAILTNEARRRTQARYRDELARLIETRRAIRLREIRKMEVDAKEEGQRERRKMERVQEERKRLLEQHVENISEYLDKKALTQEEIRILNKPS